MRRIQVPLIERDFELLVRVAQQERRHPRDQAAVVLAQWLAERTDPPAGAPWSQQPVAVSQ
jgi:hypothetical protein